MAATLIAAMSCGCCDLDTTLVEESLLVRSRVQLAWANASEVSDLGLTIADNKGYDLNDFDGYFRNIEITEAFAIIEPGTGRVGTWYRVTTTTHAGDAIVATVGEISSSTSVVEDTDPISPQYVDFLGGLDYSLSDVVVSGAYTQVLYRNFITNNIAALEWEALGDTPAPELGDWMHGIAFEEGSGYAVGREAQYTPAVVFADFDPETQVIDTEFATGDAAAPWTLKRYRWTIATETSALVGTTTGTVDWNTSYSMFVDEDPAPDTDDDTPGWTTFPALDGVYWYRVEMEPVTGQVWPGFRIV